MQKVVVILGMQRSGTSCLAGIMEGAGVNLGKISTYNLFNKKGNRENNRIMKLHDDLLNYNEGSWDNPPLKVKWPVHLRKQQDSIIGEYSRFLLWGFKDPRTLLTLDGWLDVLPNVNLVGTYRHPGIVASSLKRRDNFEFEKSFILWNIYNEKLLSYHDKYQFPIISFDLPERRYKKKITELLEFLNLDLGNNPFVFYDHGLLHRTDTHIEIPRVCMNVFKNLNRIAF